MPFPSTRAMHSRWAEHHQGAAATLLPSAVDLTRPDPSSSTWDPATGPAQDDTPPYAPGTPARVQRTPDRDGSGENAGQDVTTATYLVQVPMAAPPARLGDTVTVTTNTADPGLVGLVLTVTDITYGSTPFLRDLTCTLDLTHRQDTNTDGG